MRLSRSLLVPILVGGLVVGCGDNHVQTRSLSDAEVQKITQTTGEDYLPYAGTRWESVSNGVHRSFDFGKGRDVTYKEYDLGEMQKMQEGTTVGLLDAKVMECKFWKASGVDDGIVLGVERGTYRDGSCITFRGGRVHISMKPRGEELEISVNNTRFGDLDQPFLYERIVHGLGKDYESLVGTSWKRNSDDGSQKQVMSFTQQGEMIFESFPPRPGESKRIVNKINECDKFVGSLALKVFYTDSPTGLDVVDVHDFKMFMDLTFGDDDVRISPRIVSENFPSGGEGPAPRSYKLNLKSWNPSQNGSWSMRRKLEKIANKSLD